MREVPPPYLGEGPHALWHGISAGPVSPVELVELGNLVHRHDQAGIEPGTEEALLRFRDEVIASSLGFSRIRLHNARMR